MDRDNTFHCKKFERFGPWLKTHRPIYFSKNYLQNHILKKTDALQYQQEILYKTQFLKYHPLELDSSLKPGVFDLLWPKDKQHKDQLAQRQ